MSKFVCNFFFFFYFRYYYYLPFYVLLTGILQLFPLRIWDKIVFKKLDKHSNELQKDAMSSVKNRADHFYKISRLFLQEEQNLKKVYLLNNLSFFISLILHLTCVYIMFYHLDERFWDLGQKWMMNTTNAYRGDMFSDVALCTIQQIVSSGSEVNKTLLCSLPLNKLNYPSILSLWFLYAAILMFDTLAVLTVVYYFFNQKRAAKHYLSLINLDFLDKVDDIIEEFNPYEIFTLYVISHRCPRQTDFVDFFEELYNQKKQLNFEGREVTYEFV